MSEKNHYQIIYIMLQNTSLIILKQVSLFRHDLHYAQKTIYVHFWQFAGAVIPISFLYLSILLTQIKYNFF